MKKFLTFISCCAVCGSVAMAQAQKSTGTGLDALSDDTLMAELANRGVPTLLDRAFDVNKASPEKRDGIRTLSALRRLNDPKAKLTGKQRQQLISEIVKGIEAALPKLNDPVVLMQQAVTLIQSGVERDVNTLEYWGENPRTQGQLRPIIEAVIKILDKASEAAAVEAEKLAAAIRGPNDTTASQKWERMDGMAANAKYTRHMVDYYLTLAIDKGDPKRKEVADAGIEFLKEFDNNDSQVRPTVRNRIAKLNMVKGEFDTAKKLFQTIIDGKAPKEVKEAAASDAPKEAGPPADPKAATDNSEPIEPKPDVFQQYEARYFAAICDLLAKKFEDAQKGHDEVVTWEKESLPKDKSVQDGADAAARMMQYRIFQGQADAQSDAAQKKAIADKGVAVLQQLAKDRPELQAIINEQLMNTLPENAPLASMDSLLLQAIVAKGESQLRPEIDKPDVKLLDRCLDACRELVKRKGADKAAAEAADNASLLIPFFLQKQGKATDAATAFLDYAEQYGKDNPANAKLCLENAMAIVAQLKKDAPDDPTTVKVYDRFLPIAIGPPYNRKELAYEYARLLQRTGKYAEAASYYKMVPQDDKRVLMARFFQMVAQKQQLDDDKVKIEGPARQQLVTETQQLSDQVTQLATESLKTASGDEKNNLRSMLVRASLLNADLARREQKDPQKVLAALDGFEEKIKGLPKENELLGEALIQRVNGYMAVGQNSKATEALKKQLEISTGQQGLAMVYGLLEKLNQDLDKARASGDKAQIRTLAKNRADLSGFLVEWAEKNPNPEVKKYADNYRAFDADTKHLAAELEEDPAKRKEMLTKTLDLYKKLQQSRPDDPYVLFGAATISYDLGDCKEVQKSLSPLLRDRKLGAPKKTIQENGIDKDVDNDQYWEALYKLMRCNADLGRASDADADAKQVFEDTKRLLKKNYIQWGKQIGGVKWHPEFEALRKDIIPDFDPDTIVAPASTEPVAAQ